MKFNIFKLLSVLFFITTLISCTSVDSGHKGVKVSFGGETDTTQVYPEGITGGIEFLFGANMVEYDVREQTLVEKFEFNDINNMLTQVEVSLDYNLDPDKVNLLHVKISDYQTKLVKTVKSACKEVIPQYSAVELNITKRNEAEQKLSKLIASELPEFFIEFKRLQMTDVDIPNSVSKLAEETAVQLGRNELASKKEAEQVALAQARIAKAKGDADSEVARAKGEYEAAKFDSKTKELLSDPRYLELYRAETEREWAKKGVSPYGSNNVLQFGSGSSPLLLRK